MTLAASTAQTPVSVKATKTVSIPLTSVAANSLVALFVLSDADTGTATESLSIGTTAGLTWTRNVQANGAPGACCAIFTAPFSAGGSITPTVTDSESMSPSLAEMAIVPVIFTDSNGSIPGTGATQTGTGTTAYTSTIANSWGWGLGLGQGVDNGTQTRVYTNVAFDDGDNVNVAKSNATTATPGTSVSLDLGGLHTAIIEITPGTGGGSTPITLTEAGSESDTLSVSATVPISDTGSAADATAVSATVPLTETGSGSDAPKVNATVPTADSGSGSDAVAVAATIHANDTASAADAIAATATVALADSGSAADSISVNTGATPVSVSDSGSAADSLSVLVAAALSDAAAALDSLKVVGTIHLVDTAVGSDGIVTPGASTPITLTDTGTALDSLCVELLRPSTGTTTRPSTGTTAYATATTSRPNTGATARPDTGETEGPC